MSKRLDIVFGSKIDESGVEKDIKRIQSIMDQSGLKIRPEIDKGVVEEFRRNIKAITDKTTGLSSITSSFMKNGVKYNVSQNEISKDKWSFPKAEIDVSESSEAVIKLIRTTYRTAIEAQDELLKATKSGLLSYKNEWGKRLEEIKKEIFDLEKTAQSLGIESSNYAGVKRLKDKFSSSEISLRSEEESIYYKKALEYVEKLNSAETKLKKAKAYNDDESSIKILEREVELWREKIQEAIKFGKLNNQTMLDIYSNIWDNSFSSDSFGVVASEKQSKEDLLEFETILKRILKLKKDSAEISSKNSLSNTATEDEKEYLSVVQKQISVLSKRAEKISSSFSNDSQIEKAKSLLEEYILKMQSAQKEADILEQKRIDTSKQRQANKELEEYESLLKKINKLEKDRISYEQKNSSSYGTMEEEDFEWISYLEDEINLLKQKAQLIKSEISDQETLKKLLEAEEQYRREIEKISKKTEVDSIKKRKQETYRQEKEIYNEIIAKIKETRKLEKDLANAQIKLHTQNTEATKEQISYIDKLGEEIEENYEFIRLQKKELASSNKDLVVDIEKFESESRKTLNREIEKTISLKKKEKTTTDTLSKSFEGLVSNFINFTLMYQAINMLQNAVYNSISTIKELNQAMVDVQMVTGDTAKQTQQLAEQYSKMAERLGATTTEIAQGASDWLRQGKSLEETNELLEASMVLSKVGAVDSTQATELLTSTMNGYKMETEQAMHVVDAMSKVDIEAATSVEELAVALQNTANTARISGVSFEELLGMVGSVSEATRRSASVVGNSFKTMFSRLTNVAAGKEIDDAGESLNDVEKVLNKNGIALRNSIGEWRDMYDVISEVADRWESFTGVQREQVGTAIAGVRQREIFNSLMENWDRSQELTEAAVNSQGSAMEKFDVYLEGVEAHINEFKASWEDLIYSETSVNIFKGTIDAGKTLIDILDKLINNEFVQIIAMSSAVTVAFKGIQTAISLMSNEAKLASAGTGMQMIVSIFQKIVGLKSSVVATFTTIAASVSAIKMEAIINGASAATASMAGLKMAITQTTAAMLSSPLFVATAVIAGIYGIVKAVDALTTTTEEYKEILAETDAILQEKESYKSQLEAKEQTEGLTEAEKEYLGILQKQVDVLKEKKSIQEKDVYESEAKDRAKGSGFLGIPKISAYDLGKLRKEEKTYTVDSPFQGGIGELQLKIVELREAEEKLKETISKKESEKLKETITSTEEELVAIATDISKAISDGFDLTETDKTIKEMFEDYGLWSEFVSEGLDSAADSMNNLGNETDKTENSFTTLEEEAKTLFEQISEFSDVGDIIKDVEKEISETGQISMDSLNSLINRYPDLENVLTNYLFGLASTTDVLSAIQDAYKTDEENLYSAMLAKLKTQRNYYSLVSQLDSTLLQQLGSGYGIDFQNHSTYAQAKLDIEKQVLDKVSSTWSKYYKTQLTSIDQLLKITSNRPALLSMSASDRRAFIKASQDYKNAMSGLNDIYDNAMLDKLKTSYKEISSAMNSIASSTDKASSAQDSYNDLVKLTIEMLKKKKELEKESLKEQLDGYKKVIQAQKDLLDEQQDEYDHKKELEEKNKNISSLEAQIAELQFDTSAEGTKKRLELEEQLTEAKNELADYQHDYSVDKQKEALDKEEERYEEYINSEIDEIDRYLSETGKIQAEAIALVNERSQELFNDLIEYNRLYGDSLDSTIINAWNGATGAVNTYTEALNQASAAASALAANNERVNATMPKDYPWINKPSNGSFSDQFFEKHPEYDLDPSGSLGLSPPPWRQHHKGIDSGFVGNVKGNEEFVKALKGEAFITRQQQDKFMGKILPDIARKSMDYSSKNVFDSLLSINVEGNLDKDVVPQIEKIAKEMFTRLNNSMFKSGFKRNTSTVPF